MMEQIKEIYYHPIFKIIILLLVLWMTASISILYLEDGDLSKIENPIMPERTEFFNMLANQIWSLEEIGNGTLWKKVKNYYEL